MTQRGISHHLTRFLRLVSEAFRRWPRASHDEKFEPGNRTRAREIVAELVRLSQRRTEMAIGLVRIIFCFTVLQRFLAVNEFDQPGGRARALFEVPAMVGAAMASLPLMIRASRRDVPAWGLDCSALVDVMAAHATLLGGVLHPWPLYRGLLRIPDLAVVPVLCLAAGLRMSTRTAVTATVVNAGGFALLIALDFTKNAERADYGYQEVHLYAIYLIAAGALGLVLVTRARSLAFAAARHALRAEDVRDGLSQLLQDRHDVASLLSAARINADLLTREMARHDGERQLLSAIEGSLGDLSRIVEYSRDRAYTELASSAQVEPTDAQIVAEALLTSLRARYPSVRFVWHGGEGSEARVQVAGGARGLERIMLNLLVNAVEGRGSGYASCVELQVARRGRNAEIVVADNGPGFLEHQLQQRSERFTTTKVHGSGLGLSLVERIVLASRGSMELENDVRGARVRVMLRSGDPAD